MCVCVLYQLSHRTNTVSSNSINDEISTRNTNCNILIFCVNTLSAGAENHARS